MTHKSSSLQLKILLRVDFTFAFRLVEIFTATATVDPVVDAIIVAVVESIVINFSAEQ